MKRKPRYPIAFTSLECLPIAIEEVRPHWIISVVDPGTEFEILHSGAKRLLIECHDISEQIDGYIHPDESHIQKLIEFGAQRREHDRLVIHCQMGRSRSAATALIMMAQNNPGREIDVAMMLRKGAPHCHPNPLMIEIADRLLGSDGRLIAGLSAMGEPTVAGHTAAYYTFEALSP